MDAQNIVKSKGAEHKRKTCESPELTSAQSNSPLDRRLNSSSVEGVEARALDAAFLPSATEKSTPTCVRKELSSPDIFEPACMASDICVLRLLLGLL